MREQQTLGRRIQEARKAAGLSQESLGERLGVSRQAVSKWEADAAVPELENLIAMSRIFGVTIGALLGVEPEAAEDRSEKDAPEAPGEGVEGTAPAGELTDRELAAVEAIAKKYLDAAQVVQNPRWSRKKKIAVSAGICGAALTAALALGSGLSALGSRLDQVQSQVYGIESSVSGQIGALAGQIRDLLDEDSNLFAVSQARVTDYDLAAGTVTLQVSAQAKSWQDNTTALFTALLSDGRQFSAEASGKNGTFTAQNWTLPMDQEILLSASLTTDGVTARRPVGNFVRLSAREISGWMCGVGSAKPTGPTSGEISRAIPGRRPARNSRWAGCPFPSLMEATPISAPPRLRWRSASTEIRRQSRNRPSPFRRPWSCGQRPGLWKCITGRITPSPVNSCPGKP